MKENKVKVVEKEDFVIDAIAMKQRIQEKIYQETQGMSAEELIAYFRKRVADSEFAPFLDKPSSIS